MPRIFCCRAPLHALLLAVLFCAAPVSAADSLVSRLRALADSHGFYLQGIEKVGTEPAVSVQGELAAELRLLLAGYNHVVEGVPPSVQRVIILGVKQPSPRSLVTRTTRHNGSHVVNAALQGVVGFRVTAALIVDTGASSLVLPDSMMAPLGFTGENLAQRRGQTVNGLVMGRVAQLASVAVGDAVARDVEVLFVADERLGGVSLLGMSFLDRFSVTIDKTDNRLVLTPR